MTVPLVAFLIACSATWLLIPVLRRAHVVDVPNPRSSHLTATPRGGGLGVLAGVAGGVLVAGAQEPQVVVVLGAGLLAGILGFVDDVWSLAVSVRLLAQAVLGLVVALWLASQHLGNAELIGVGGVIGAVWLVGYVNAFNFMDGINGISGLSAVVAGGWFAWLGQHYHQPAVAVLGLALAGASAGFLPWNLPKARVFLGDVGSYGIGMVVASTSLVGILNGIPLWVSAAPLAIYLTDTAWALTKRLLRGDSWREAHREHVYQRLVDTGWSHTAGAILVALAALLLAVTSAVLPVGWFGVCTLAVVLAYLGLPAAITARPVASK